MTQDTYWDKPAFRDASGLDRSVYNDPASVQLQLDGRSIAAAMPPPVLGARGVIVKASTAEGAPIGYDPNARATVVNIDPEINGGFQVDFSKLTKEGVEQAVVNMGVRQSGTVEERRYRASMALKQFASHVEPVFAGEIPQPERRDAPLNMPGLYVTPASTPGGAQQVPRPQQASTGVPQGVVLVSAPAAPVPVQQPPQPQPQQPLAYPQAVRAAEIPLPQPVQMQQPNQQAIHPLATPQYYPQSEVQGAPMPMPVHAPPLPTSLFDRPGLAIQSPYTQQPSGLAGPPTIKVTFEVRGAPWRQEAYYHHVCRENNWLLLALDSRAVGFPRVFPQDVEQDVAVHIEGKDMILVCQMMGCQVHFLDYDLCMLLIKEEHPLQ